MTGPPAGDRISELSAGIALPVDLAEADARRLVAALAARYGWLFLLWDRADGSAVLREYRQDTADEVSLAEWRRVARTPAGAELADTARRAYVVKETIIDGFGQAGLECAECAVRLTEPPAVTGRLCNAHRVGVNGQPAVADPSTEGLYWMTG
ncbi:hypothetical protein [Phytohabitans houttuyneae]|uniref:Uncharacterized protein n=1 Tax=Phytohabitans houttuyneae TaxID=1076126 RepID=A0A6V8KVE5_9ACTN|nr:hypothetical protein [Phytohabitans houttuyneae]GFJ85796.1 hypothetical protein Phou_099760 [Phytohabitans houttuyneae]